MYSQTDPRWSKKKVGFGTSNFAQVGCTVTCLTNWMNKVMGWDLKPDEVNSRLKEVKGFTGSYLIWSAINRAYPEVKFIWRGYNYENLKVSMYVYVKKLPVLVEVNNKGTKHWVLFIGYKKMVDPLDGKVYSTSKYPTTGYTLLEKVSKQVR